MWESCGFTKSEINLAGRKIIAKNISSEERNECLKVINSWRRAHAYPMNTFAINLRHIVNNIDGAVVVQRLKRLKTIEDKLVRFPEMELYRMQDLGGCRVIVPSVEDVYTVVKRMEQSRIRHKKAKPKDYIQAPNPDTGYRGYHLIYQYHSERNTKFNGLRIEIQVRTALQHSWATAVETVGEMTSNGLKFNQGDERWLLFF